MARKDKGEKKQSSISKLIQAYKMTRERDKRVGIICLAWFLGVGLVAGGLFWYFLHPVAGVLVGLSSGALAWMIVFGRRAERAAYAQMEGQPGAAAAALGVLRRGWHVQPTIAVTKNQDLVHRVVGRPGVILIGEGNPQRVRNLLGVEKKKHARVVADTPIYDILSGDQTDGGDDVVPINRLSKHIMKLPKNIAPADVTDVLQRLKALDAMRPTMPIPRGPMPTSAKQARQAARQSMRGR